MNRTQALLSEFLAPASPGVVEWLESNIYLPRKFSPRGFGKFSTRGRPFQKTILECFHPNSGVSDCVVSGGTQLAKTTILLLGAAYRMVWQPLPALLAVPSIDFAKKKLVQRRLHPLINENEVLAALKPDDPDHFSLTEMHLRGGELTLAGSGSATNLSSISAGLIYQDECCKFIHRESEDEPEAHPMHLADERAKDFQDLAFRYKSSSPNSEHHPFWHAFEEGSQTQFYVPCPNCGHYFPFEFVREMDGEADSRVEYRSIVWDSDARDSSGLWDQDKVKATARYVCRSCGYKIQSSEKSGMLERFELKDGNEGAGKSVKSFLCPSFLSPNVSFGEMAWQFLRGHDFLGLQNFTNSWLALPFSEVAAKVTDATIRGLVNKEYRRGVIPRPPQSLIVLADPGQTSGCHWMVCAVMDDGEIYVIDWGSVLGVDDLNEQPRKASYPLAGTTRRLAPAAGLCDSRYNSDAVFSLCARSGGFWTPTRGSDATVGHWTATPVSSYPGMRLIAFVDHALKTELYGRRIAAGSPPRVHLPADADTVLIAQLSGQQQDARTGKWKRLPNDHLGDCLKQAVLYQWVSRAVMATIQGATARGGR
jgi:DNA-directed RNA polymerase subunit RPC12/RpoP